MINDLKVGFFSAKSSIRRGNKKTSFFIIFVLGLIFMNLIFLPALINGMEGIFVSVVQDYAYGDILIQPSMENNYINNADNVLKKIRSVNGVTGATPRLEGGVSITYKQKIVGANIIGMIPSSEEEVSLYPFSVIKGEFLSDASRDEIMLGAIIEGTGTGSDLYDSLDGVQVGSFVNVTYSNGVTRTYKVRGVHQGTVEMTDLNALIHYKELQDVLGLEDGKASSIIVRIDDGEEEVVIKDKIIGVGVNEKVFTWQEKAEALIKQALQTIGSIGTMSKVVSLIVGAALIFIIIYINTLNRKREIGILKAIGITPNSIRISYIFISLFYVILGILLGLAMFFAITFYLKANPIVFYETLYISPIVNFDALIRSVFIMVGMSLVAGFIPAWFVTRQDILEAIWGR
jgi:putative ABC transport system permease protein